MAEGRKLPVEYCDDCWLGRVENQVIATKIPMNEMAFIASK
jgi:hypothetical protein